MPRDEAAWVSLVAESFAGALAEGAQGFLNDGAILPPLSPGATRVATTDMAVEEVDFSVGLGPLASAGARAIVQNASDLAAMGATPVGFVWSLALPPAWLARDGEWFREYVRGAADMARALNMPLFGGDLSSTRGPMVCSLTAFGDVRGVPLTRTGARPGDALVLSRGLGGARAGLEVLLAAREAEPERFAPGPVAEMTERFGAWQAGLPADRRAWIDLHLWPWPELELARALVGRASACMDISDGLATDLYRLTQASGVGARLEGLEALWHPRVAHDEKSRQGAIDSGEEYALLFTLPEGTRIEEEDLGAAGMGAEGLASASFEAPWGQQERAGPPPWRTIGRIIAGTGVWFREGGEDRPLPRRGWDHFGGVGAG